MALQETEHLTRVILGPAAARAVGMVADLGIADHIQPGAPRSAAYLAEATGFHERSRRQNVGSRTRSLTVCCGALSDHWLARDRFPIVVRGTTRGAEARMKSINARRGAGTRRRPE